MAKVTTLTQAHNSFTGVYDSRPWLGSMEPSCTFGIENDNVAATSKQTRLPVGLDPPTKAQPATGPASQTGQTAPNNSTQPRGPIQQIVSSSSTAAHAAGKVPGPLTTEAPGVAEGVLAVGDTPAGVHPTREASTALPAGTPVQESLPTAPAPLTGRAQQPGSAQPGKAIMPAERSKVDEFCSIVVSLLTFCPCMSSIAKQLCFRCHSSGLLLFNILQRAGKSMNLVPKLHIVVAPVHINNRSVSIFLSPWMSIATLLSMMILGICVTRTKCSRGTPADHP